MFPVVHKKLLIPTRRGCAHQRYGPKGPGRGFLLSAFSLLQTAVCTPEDVPLSRCAAGRGGALFTGMNRRVFFWVYVVYFLLFLLALYGRQICWVLSINCG